MEPKNHSFLENEAARVALIRSVKCQKPFRLTIVTADQTTHEGVTFNPRSCRIDGRGANATLLLFSEGKSFVWARSEGAFADLNVAVKEQIVSIARLVDL